MQRNIIKIDKEKCVGCGLCVNACHQGAIGLNGGKAELLREDYCDGLGKCLPVCPAGAITMEELAAPSDTPAAATHLNQWPVQIKLVPVNAPYFAGADLLISADCAAYAYGSFHGDFMRGRITLIGCPKLDDTDYSEKLRAVLKENDIQSVTVARMEVPCCGGIEHAVMTALKESGKAIPWRVVIISTDGRLLKKTF